MSASPAPGDDLSHPQAVPPLVRAATLAFGALMLAMTFLYPVNYGYDEPQHFDMAYSFATGHGIYGPGERKLATDVRTISIEFARGYPPVQHFADTPIPGRADRKPLADYGGDHPTAVPNQMVQHPPLYYLLAAVVIDLPGVSRLPYDVEFTLVRLLSLLLLLPLPYLCYLTARRFGAGLLAPSASLLPLLFPCLARLGGSVTNDSLMVLTASLALYLITRVVTGDGSTRTAAYLAAALVAALLTKGFALLLPLVAVLGYLVYAWRYRARPVRELVIVCAGSAVGGLWWLHNLIAYGAVQPDGFGPGYVDAIYRREQAVPGPGAAVPFLKEAVRFLIGRYWGAIGLAESPDYNWSFTWIATTLAVLAVLLGLVRGAVPRPTADPDRGRRLALAAPLLMLPLSAALLIAGAWPNYHRYVLLTGIQGRYLYPALAPCTAAAVLGLGVVVRGRAVRFVPLTLVVVALYAQLWTAWTVGKAWWRSATPDPGASGWRDALHVLLDWAPWPVGFSAGCGVLIVAAVGWLMVQAVVVALRDYSDGDASSAPREVGG